MNNLSTFLDVSPFPTAPAPLITELGVNPAPKDNVLFFEKPWVAPELYVPPEKKIIKELTPEVSVAMQFDPNKIIHSTSMLDKPSTLIPAKVMKLWQKKPKIFFRDVMDVTLDTWQDDVVELYMHKQRVGMLASKGPGKTATLAFIGWHFFICHHRPKIAALSISHAHLMSNLWAELLMWRSTSRLLTLSTTDGQSRIALKGFEGFSFIDARSYPKQANENDMASALAGLHADNVGFLIDEAGSIPDSVLATADAALAGEESDRKKARLLVTANPEQPQGMIYRAAKGRTVQEWAIYRVSGDPEDPKRAPRVSVKWAQEQINTYGRDNPWVMVNVLALYPNVSSEKLITEEEVHAAMARDIPEKEVRRSQVRLGLDVARGGIDNSALCRRRGLKAYPLELMPSTADGPTLAGKVVFMHREFRIERVFVDNTGGYGSSAIDQLKFYPKVDVTPVVYNSSAQDNRYFNCRTEMWVRMRDWIRNGGELPNDPMLAEEILAPKIFFVNGKLRLEEKDQIKARLGRSPDRADALAQTFKDVEEESRYQDNYDSYEEMLYKGVRPSNRNYFSDESHRDPYYDGENSNYEA